MISPPPFRLYLMRHGQSGPPAAGERDFDRTLTDQGYAETELIADLAADRGYRPDLVISSTARRCRETTQAVCRAIDETLEPAFIDNLYNAPLSNYLAIVSAQKDIRSLMIVGHNPALEELLSVFVGGDAVRHAIPTGFPPTGLAVIDHSEAGADWILADMLRP